MKRSKAALKINWARLVTVLFFDHAVFGLKYDIQIIGLKSREAKRLGSVKVIKLSGSTARKFSEEKFMKRSKAAQKNRKFGIMVYTRSKLKAHSSREREAEKNCDEGRLF